MHININFPILFIGNLHLGLLSNIYIGNGYSCQKVELKNAVHISKFHIACPACMGGEPVQWLTRRFTCFNQNLQSNLYRPLHSCPEFQKLSQAKISYFVCFIWKINMLRNNTDFDKFPVKKYNIYLQNQQGTVHSLKVAQNSLSTF